MLNAVNYIVRPAFFLKIQTFLQFFLLLGGSFIREMCPRGRDVSTKILVAQRICRGRDC